MSDFPRIIRPTVIAALCCAAVAACASSKRGAPAAADGASAPLSQQGEPARPLAAFMPHRLIVLPVQSLRRDTLGVSARAGEARAFLGGVDRAIADSVGARGLRGRWVFADAVVQSARRNPTYATDPYAIAVSQLRAAATRSNGDPLPEPVASQLRVLVGLQDARLALVPLDLRFEPAPGGATRAVLALVLVDARGSQILRAQTVVTAPFTDLSPVGIGEVAGAVAGRLADLIAAP